ncbi:Nif3-like dinuclear metal center hexameric protein [Micromonospora sp. RTGN7]|uniref:Nif3-like dinuclear metal center hexameric protein n=1 Tax=Micromonospora sp. RTGN7 TaxID=3016526 RepID=UPI0029FECCBF|nr:Nif3-like dinuclear metal center hexameric protein [Micromonospora sp. RTGN7]
MTAPATVGEVTGLLEQRHPADLADPADRVGLLAGRSDAPVRQVLLAVDAVDATVAEALACGADLLVTHRPPDPATLARAEAAGLALHVGHSNAAVARPGASDALAARLGVGPTDPLVPVARRRDVLVAFVPPADTDRLIDAVAAAGAGVIGDYRRCAWWATGTGSFVPHAGARPVAGTVGVVHLATEVRVEMVLPRSRRADVLAAARAAHPYEEPACYLFELAEVPDGHGHGRVGELPRVATVAELAARLGGSGPAVRVAGDVDRPVRTLAVCAGAGAAYVEAAARRGVDAYLSGDLAATGGAPVLVDAGRWATVRPWLDALARAVSTRYRGRLPVRVSRLNTDPWFTLETVSNMAAGFPPAPCPEPGADAWRRPAVEKEAPC